MHWGRILHHPTAIQKSLTLLAGAQGYRNALTEQMMCGVPVHQQGRPALNCTPQAHIGPQAWHATAERTTRHDPSPHHSTESLTQAPLLGNIAQAGSLTSYHTCPDLA
eukprot:scaffold18013_cov137-Isochrysis_galbana.AAC.3